MVFHFAVFFWTALFYLGLEIIAHLPVETTWSWYVWTILPLVLLAVETARRLTRKTGDASLPVLLALMTPTLLSLIDHPGERQAFIVVASLMYYCALLGIYRLRYAPEDKTARAILNTSAMAALFFFFASVYGFYVNFTFPLWGMMFLFFVGASFTSFITFQGFAKGNLREVKLYSLILGLIMGELAWIASFWPFGYLTAASLSLIIFFMAWDIAVDALRQSLWLKRTVSRTAFFVFMGSLLLASSPWRILV